MLEIFSFPNGIPKRVILMVMMFFACFISYMFRVHLSVTIIAMKVNTPDKNQTYEDANPDYGKRYDWNQEKSTNMLGAYFPLYAVASLFGGPVTDYFGGRAVIGWTTLITVILNLLTGVCLDIHYYVGYLNRFIVGGLGGFVFPACHNLIGKWAPPEERGLFVASLMGGTCSTILVWPIGGVVVEDLGWPWAFYITSILGGIFGFLWLYLIVDRPSEHSTITQKELEYIETKQGTMVAKEKLKAPYLDIAMSIPFWALLILHFGNMWGLYFLLTVAPKFMSEILKFKLRDAGGVSALPYLARLISAFAFGALGDFLRVKEYVSVTFIRKFFCIFSHVLPGIFLAVIGVFVRDTVTTITFIVLSLGFNGAATITNLQNSQDLSPNFAGTLYGTINFFGNMPGFIIPAIVGDLTKDENTFEQWKYIFLIGSIAYILPAIVYAFIGTANVQPWNNKKNNET